MDRTLGCACQPWPQPGTLRLEQAPHCSDHIASPDLHLDRARREILMYFRVCRRGGYYYTMVRAGQLLRSPDMRSAFEPGPTVIPADSSRILRHAAVDLQGDTLRVYYSRIGDRPERILHSEVRMLGDWSGWRGAEPVTVLSPEKDYEGADRPLEVSRPDEAPGRVRQLRDPAIFQEDGKTYLLYSIAGESGPAIAELRD